MSIFIDNDTKLVVQGITGRDGSFHTLQTMEYGTNVVGGVTPGKGGQTFEGPNGQTVPIFNAMDEAVAETGANTSVIFVPPAIAAGAVLEAADSGVALVVAITEGVPVLDMARAHVFARDKGVRVLGPNCPGLISPGKAKVGILPGQIVTEGPIGLVRSPTKRFSSSRVWAWGKPPAWVLAEIRSSGRTLSTVSRRLRPTPTRRGWSCSGRSVAPTNRRLQRMSATTCPSRWWDSSPARRLHRDEEWDMLARSSAAQPVRLRKR